MTRTKQAALVCGAFMLGALCHAQMRIGKYEAGPQIVAIVNHTESTGKRVLILPEVVPILTVIDAEGQHSAPMENGTKLLCRELYEYQDNEGVRHLAFSCGGNQLVTTGINFMDRKEVKKYVQEPTPIAR